jgi:hypothetical protein
VNIDAQQKNTPATGVPLRSLDQPTPQPGALARGIEDPALRLADEGSFA